MSLPQIITPPTPLPNRMFLVLMGPPPLSVEFYLVRSHVFTFDNCCEIFNTSNNVEVIQMFDENFFDLKSLLNDICNRPDPKNVITNHVLQMRKYYVHIGQSSRVPL